MIKPDAIERDLVEIIREEIQSSGLAVTTVGQANFTLNLVQDFYQFENSEWTEVVYRYLSLKPVPLWIIEGPEAVSRTMEVKRNIRERMRTGNPQNLLHCSSSEESFRLEYSVLVDSGMIDL